MSEDLDPDIVDVLSDFVEARLATVFTAFPAAVVSYDAAAQVVDVQPQVQDHTFDTDGSVVARRLPVLPRIPVQRWTGGAFFLGGPVVVGDTGLVICCTLPIDRWRSTGQETTPNDTRRHSVTSGVFVPGLLPTARNVSELVGNTDAIFGRRGGSMVRIKDNDTVEIGTAPTQFAALANRVLTELQALRSVVNSHTHLYAPGPGSPTPTAVAVPQAAAPGSVAAAQVKIK